MQARYTIPCLGPGQSHLNRQSPPAGPEMRVRPFGYSRLDAPDAIALCLGLICALGVPVAGAQPTDCEPPWCAYWPAWWACVPSATSKAGNDSTAIHFYGSIVTGSG
jgi:hypothetical protein